MIPHALRQCHQQFCACLNTLPSQPVKENTDSLTIWLTSNSYMWLVPADALLMMLLRMDGGFRILMADCDKNPMTRQVSCPWVATCSWIECHQGVQIVADCTGAQGLQSPTCKNSTDPNSRRCCKTIWLTVPRRIWITSILLPGPCLWNVEPCCQLFTGPFLPMQYPPCLPRTERLGGASFLWLVICMRWCPPAILTPPCGP